MDEALAALAGAVVGGLFTFLVNEVTYRRETGRREQEAVQREKEWLRGQLLDAYSNGIYYLTKLTSSSKSLPADDKDVRQHFSESLRYLYLLRAYHERTGQAGKVQTIIDNLTADGIDLSAVARDSCFSVQDLLKTDSRLNVTDTGMR